MLFRSIPNKLKLAKHNILASSDKPLKFISIITLFYGFGLFLYTIYLVLINNFNSKLIWAWLFLTQFMFISIIADYVGKTYIESKNRPNYIIDRIVESEMKCRK